MKEVLSNTMQAAQSSRCHLYFVVKSPYACPRCTPSDFKEEVGDCKDGTVGLSFTMIRLDGDELNGIRLIEEDVFQETQSRDLHRRHTTSNL